MPKDEDEKNTVLKWSPVNIIPGSAEELEDWINRMNFFTRQFEKRQPEYIGDDIDITFSYGGQGVVAARNLINAGEPVWKVMAQLDGTSMIYSMGLNLVTNAIWGFEIGIKRIEDSVSKGISEINARYDKALDSELKAYHENELQKMTEELEIRNKFINALKTVIDGYEAPEAQSSAGYQMGAAGTTISFNIPGTYQSSGGNFVTYSGSINYINYGEEQTLNTKDKQPERGDDPGIR
jgi:hypothetical protein